MQKQPKALPFLFLTETWERFGFYIVQGLLILYMTQYFGLPDNESYSLLGMFTALVYIAPLAGGYLASRFIGLTPAIIWGGVLLTIGYFLLALPNARLLLYPALATIIVGTGLFKPNVSSLLGTQYQLHDPRREAGFTIFYIGINVGALMAGLSSGYIKDHYGWRMSFGLASIGLVIGLATFCYGLKFITNRETHKPSRLLHKFSFLFATMLAIIGAYALLTFHTFALWLLPCVGVLLLAYLTWLTWQQNAEYKLRLFMLNILILASIVFWMLFLQIFYSANLFVDRLVAKNLFGLTLNTTVFYASEGLFIILLGPFFAWLWQWLSHRQQNPAPFNKFIFGIFLAGLSFVILACSTYFPDSQGLIHPAWIFATYFTLTIGELFLSPIGLSAVTMLAPTQLVGLMMGVWFVASGYGGIFAGWIAKLSSVPDNITSETDKLLIYHHAFLTYAAFAFVATLLLLLLRLVLKRANIPL